MPKPEPAPQGQTGQEPLNPTPAPQTPTKKSFTDWTAFTKAGLVPNQIRCEAYKPVHMADMSCHTKLLFNAATLKRHTLGEHGGGFHFELRKTDGKASPLWTEMSDLGLESYDFRCDNCDAQLRFSPSSIIPHLRAHGGKTRRVYPGGHFNLTIGFERPNTEDTDTDL